MVFISVRDVVSIDRASSVADLMRERGRGERGRERGGEREGERERGREGERGGEGGREGEREREIYCKSGYFQVY